MALINCSECGKEISDKASACPTCGCPVEYLKNEADPISNSNLSCNHTGTTQKIPFTYSNAAIKNAERIRLITFIALFLCITINGYMLLEKKGFSVFMSPKYILKHRLNISKLDVVTKVDGLESCYWFDDKNNNLNNRKSGFAIIEHGRVKRINFYDAPLEVGAIETCKGRDYVSPIDDIFSGRGLR